MTGGSILIGAGSIAAIAAIGLLRVAWGRRARSAVLNAAAWGLLLAGLVAAGLAAGVWGVAVASLCAMLAAFLALAVAGARAPARPAKASNRRVGMLPEGGEPRRIGRRFGTFALVVIAGFAVSIGLALAVRSLGGMLGWQPANANALALFTAPLAWAVLCTVLLMQTRRRSQVLTLALCALPVVPVLLTGALA
jgi:hypothetical protein